MTTLDQIKVTHITWDGDANPKGFHIWVQQWSAMVRTQKGGEELETFLDGKLRRTPPDQSRNIPSCITGDPDFMSKEQLRSASASPTTGARSGVSAAEAESVQAEQAAPEEEGAPPDLEYGTPATPIQRRASGSSLEFRAIIV